MWRPNTPSRAVIFGLAVGFGLWFWALPLPALIEAAGANPAWLRDGPFGLAWLGADRVFGLTGRSRLGRAVGLGLLFGTLGHLVGSEVRAVGEEGVTKVIYAW